MKKITARSRILSLAVAGLALAAGAGFVSPVAAEASATSGTVRYSTLADCTRQVAHVRSSNYYTATNCYQLKNSTGWYYTWYAPKTR